MTTPEPKHPPPFSFRLTQEERVQLQQDAAGMSMGGYIRTRIFDKTVPKSRTRNRYPVKDHQALGQVLGELGRSHLSSNLNQLAKAANSELLDMSPETEQALQVACADIRWMRNTLIAALGLNPEVPHDS